MSLFIRGLQSSFDNEVIETQCSNLKTFVHINEHMFSLLNSKEEKLLETLCIFPTRDFTVSGLSREAELSKGLVSNKVSRLDEENLINVEERSNQKIISFNRGNDEALKLKQLINLNNLYSSGVIDDLIDLYNYPEAIVLFGSFANGEDTENSDIDVAVITSENKSYENKIMDRPVSVKEFNEGITGNMLESLANGITIYGYLEV